MRLSSLADYAIVILSAAARRCGARGRLNATLLAAETGVPLPTVQKLVSKLSAAGLIETLRGPGGGLRLALPPALINPPHHLSEERPLRKAGGSPFRSWWSSAH